MGFKYPLSIVVRAVDKATAPLRGINANLAKMTRPFSVGFSRLSNKLGALAGEARLPQLVEGFKRAGGALWGAGKEAWALGKQLGAVAVVGGTLFFGLLHGAINAGDTLAEVSQRLGMTANGFAQLQFAAEQSDVPAEAFTDAMDKLNKSMGELHAGGGPLLSFLQKVSPTLLRQVKATHSTEEAFYLLTHAFEKVKDTGRRAALTGAAFGKGAKAMGEFAGLGAKAIDALRSRFGALAGDQDLFAKRSSDADNALRESETALLGVRNVLATGLLPAVTQLSTALANFIAQHRVALAEWAERTGAAISKWVEGGGLDRLGATLKQIGDTLGSVVDGLGGMENVVKLVALAMSAKFIIASGQAVVALVQLGGAIASVAIRLGSLLFGPVVAALGTFIGALVAGTPIVTAFNVALTANPIGVIIVLIGLLAGAVYLIYRNWGSIAGFFKRVWGGVAGLAVKVWGGIRDFFKGLWEDITGFFVSAWDKIKPIVEVMMKVAAWTSPVGLAVQAGQAASDWWNSAGNGGAAPPAPAPAPLRPPVGAAGGESRVVVDFNGLPRGARVQADPQGDAPLDLNLGYTMVGG